MHEVRWFEVTAVICERAWERNFYFAEYSNGEFQFFQPVAYNTGSYASLRDAVRAFQTKFEREHDFGGRGLSNLAK
jgi:hypothetical protein